jgi:hypothetical protein
LGFGVIESFLPSPIMGEGMGVRVEKLCALIGMLLSVMIIIIDIGYFISWKSPDGKIQSGNG